MFLRRSLLIAGIVLCPCLVLAQATAPASLRGTFQDDYNIRYVVSDTLIQQGSRLRYRVLSWHAREQYLIARNDSTNPADGGLFTRIDWVMLADMPPYTWAYCLTAYRAPTADSARAAPPADRQNPRTGCNGFPFSRMAPHP